MAIKQRVLQKLIFGESNLHRAMETKSNEDVAALCLNLQEAREMCRQGLPEKIYGIYGEIYDGLLLALSQLYETEVGERGEALLLCRELWQYLAVQLDAETRFKKEIVFLPYQASMWDSMDSVWRAAAKDTDHAIAYVVPIPYCDRHPDGTVREWHNDAPRFPKYVPVCDYRQIDLESMHPDVIIICNPYDDTNIVTSVDPAYYARTLKYYTDKLVYIPYFVLQDVVPWEEDVEKRISHFVLRPGVTESHLTIVQSEAMRQAYIDILTRRTNKKERAYWENRILGLGSPKFDNLCVPDTEIRLPASWRRIIERADGTRKKVFFYNVGLSDLLCYKDVLLDKMEWVFDTFRARQNEVALLWRPHPMFLSTLESMEPELLERYRNMVAAYKQEGWGIYDDSSDLHRAIVVSDAYYAGGSSVVELFQAAGKPVMLHCVINIKNCG